MKHSKTLRRVFPTFLSLKTIKRKGEKMKFILECCHENNWREMELQKIKLVSTMKSVGRRHDSFLLYFYKCLDCNRENVIRHPIETHLIESDTTVITDSS